LKFATEQEIALEPGHQAIAVALAVQNYLGAANEELSGSAGIRAFLRARGLTNFMDTRPAATRILRAKPPRPGRKKLP
jgi:hypothetical protein